MAEYFYVQEDSIPDEDSTGEMSAKQTDESDSPAPTRPRKRQTVKWAKIAAHDIIEEETVIPGQLIPVVEVLATRLIVDGKNISPEWCVMRKTRSECITTGPRLRQRPSLSLHALPLLEQRGSLRT